MKSLMVSRVELRAEMGASSERRRRGRDALLHTEVCRFKDLKMLCCDCGLERIVKRRRMARRLGCAFCWIVCCYGLRALPGYAPIRFPKLLFASELTYGVTCYRLNRGFYHLEPAVEGARELI